MSDTADERENQTRLQAIDVEQAQRVYQRTRDEYRHGVRRITANAREEIAKLRFARDEALLRIRREQTQLTHLQAVSAKGFD